MKGIIIENVLSEGCNRDILIEGRHIKSIVERDRYEKSAEEARKSRLLQKAKATGEYRIVDGRGKAVIPGFVNMHTHSAMTLMRGCNEDAPLKEWLDSIWRIEPRLDEELIYWGTKLACLEMIKTGTTTFNDQYWMIESAVKASVEMGIRSYNSFVFLDMNDESRDEALKEECCRLYEASGKWGELAHFAIAVHAPYSNSESCQLWASEFAKKKDLLLHIHISETENELDESLQKYNMSPVERLEKMGVLSPNVLAAHCVWISGGDIEILGRNRVKVVHNINSNLKLASGYKFKYKELKEAGATVCIGTDGCASSNNLDMLEAMKTSALLQKAWRRDPKAMPLNDLLDSATINGAQSLRLNSGKIEEGRLADILIIDVDNYAFTPNYNFIGNLIYSANSSCIEDVICNGEFVMENRVVKGEREILDNVNRLYKKLL